MPSRCTIHLRPSMLHPGKRAFRPSDAAAILFTAALAAVFVAAPLPRPAPAPARMLLPLVVTAVFALLAALARGVDLSGALAGYAIAFILAARDLKLFYVLLIVFAVTFAATRLGRERKQEMRKAEARGGRSASQVAANLGAAALVVMLAPAHWPVMALAALAEAAADTSSSEIGLAFPGKTVLITNWKAVTPGMDGAVSLLGTVAAILAAALIAASGRFLGLISSRQAVVVLFAGFLGTLIDSLLGAILERRGYLNNDLVNLLSTAASVGIAAVSL
ncbi:MAG TPA: DUF92 domain-containing protein [Candidatus Angelobacter sp.]|nr:DUF92 domain-containing protein [Candidatus Angelobacter sp.]